MFVQKIDFNNVKSIEFNKQEVFRVILNGVIVWTKEHGKVFVRVGEV